MQSLPQDDRRDRRFLYKYLSVNPGASDHWLEKKKLFDLLLTGELYMSSVDQFNDPNEFRAKLQWTDDSNHLRSWAWMMLVREGRVPPNAEADNFSSLIDGICDNAVKNPNVLQSAYEINVSRIGVYCFSRNPRSHLMWAHYARNHRGVCIQIDPSYCLDVFAGVQTVSYTNNLPKVIWPTRDSDDITKCFLSKSMDWAYEKEIRCVSRYVKNSGMRFDVRAVRGIIFGQRFFDSPDVFGWIKEALLERSKLGLDRLNAYKVVQDSNTYSFAVARMDCDDLNLSLSLDELKA